MNIDSIITEWTYRLEKGYPDCDEDYIELHNVLREQTDLSKLERDNIVRRAMGITEQDDDPEYIVTTPSQVEEFISYINSKYVMSGQEISNLKNLYQLINQSEVKQNILDIIYSKTPYYNINNTDYKISGDALILYNMIRESGIIVTNGHWSELWFSIIFKGLVKGSIAGDDDNIKSDIKLNTGDDVSLKAFKRVLYDCGSLPADAILYLRRFISLAELLTDITFETKSISTIELNKILKTLSSERVQDDIKQILYHQTELPIIQRIQNKLKNILGDSTPDRLENIVNVFCRELDEVLRNAFVEQIDWWGFINTSNNIIFIRDSESIFQQVKCNETNPRISPAIPNFHQGKVWIKGTELGMHGRRD
jgi:hypothetical protein